MTKKSCDFIWELFSFILLVAILVALPVAIFRYDTKVAQGYPGKVITLVGRNDNRPGKTGAWMIQRGTGWDYTQDGRLSVIRARQGEMVTLRLTAVDNVHGFSVPDYGLEEKVYPGRISAVSFRAEKAGTFVFNCSIYCGIGHHEMTGQIVVEPVGG